MPMEPLRFRAAAPLGVRRALVTSEQALAQRVQFVLETRPGTLPWRPSFGCDLAKLVGEPATDHNLALARFHVERAVGRWLAEVSVLRCDISIKMLNDPNDRPRAPTAEAALVALGTHAELIVHLELQTPDGPARVSAAVVP